MVVLRFMGWIIGLLLLNVSKLTNIILKMQVFTLGLTIVEKLMVYG